MRSHDEWLTQRIVPWAEAEPNVRAMAELGSRSHAEPVDEWADMDLLLLVVDRDPILESDTWLERIGPHWVALRHPGPFPDLPVRQVLFEGALDFDIIPMAAGSLLDQLRFPYIAELIGGGLVPVLDKDGELALADSPALPTPLPANEITREAFDFVVGDFLFQSVWAAKHLRRGELWAAKDDVDGYMKSDLVKMLEWHTISHRPETLPREGGRFLERWADDRFVAAAPRIFATYEAASVARALIEMIGVFAWVAQETAKILGFAYPVREHGEVAEWVRVCLAEYL